VSRDPGAKEERRRPKTWPKGTNRDSCLMSHAVGGITAVPEVLLDDPGRGPVVAVLCKPGVLLSDLRMCRVSK
jgi:hypothetical protein